MQRRENTQDRKLTEWKKNKEPEEPLNLNPIRIIRAGEEFVYEYNISDDSE